MRASIRRGLALLLAACAQGITPGGDSGYVPPGGELCDGVDNDGDGEVDEDTALQMCGPIPNGVAICLGHQGCLIGSCHVGWADVDGSASNGCECATEPGENGDATCAGARDLGSVNDDGSSLEVSGTLAPESDVDFYRFTALDSPDTSCDTYHVRVQFLANPDDEFQLDAWRGGCDSGAPICQGATDIEWYTDFHQAGDPAAGECPCRPSDSTSPEPECADDGIEYVVRVMRVIGRPPSCNEYRLEISNGKYPAP